MGFFSWIKSDDDKPVRNRWTDDGPTPVKMLDDTGREWIELAYDGYGEFGGMDWYALAAYMNGTPETVPQDEARSIGIEICDVNHFDPAPDHIKTPRLVDPSCDKAWADLEPTKNDPDQGFFNWS